MMNEVMFFILPLGILWLLALSVLVPCLIDAIGDYCLSKQYGHKDLKERRIVVGLLSAVVFLTAISPILFYVLYRCL